MFNIYFFNIKPLRYEPIKWNAWMNLTQKSYRLFYLFFTVPCADDRFVYIHGLCYYYERIST